jgi:hypothetical protein
MKLRATLLLLIPCLLLAQVPAAQPSPSKEQAPKEVDAALRSRAEEFMKLQLEGSFRKAFAFVADDTQDFYFQAQHPKYLSYKIETVEFSEQFTKAVVDVAVMQSIVTAQGKFDIPMTLKDTWKLEDGKWVWYKDATIRNGLMTPFGPIQASTDVKGTDANPTKPGGLPDSFNADAALTAARNFKVETSLDKQELNFVSGKPGTQELVFHNGVPGIIRIVVTVTDRTQVISASPKDVTVGANGDQKITVVYSPSDKEASDTNPLRQVAVVVEPFGKTYRVPVKISSPPQSPAR